jgi:murein DD-endopeptidase MepM/ murein hydrolase activator NlpD
MAQPNNGRERVQKTVESVGGVLARGLAALMRGVFAVGERIARVPWGSVRPGWYLIGALALWSLVATAQWMSSSAQLTEANARLQAFERQAALENARLTLPVAGAAFPRDPDNLPNAPRTYRKGVSQGFVFTGSDSGVIVTYGTPVIAAADGEIVKLDANYKDPTVPEFLKLLQEVKNGASDNDLERLRGRQVWLKHANGVITRYGHLSKIAPDLSYARPVKRGDVIGFVGNSGTLEGARGGRGNARLLFEVWPQPEQFLGQGLEPAAVRIAAAKLFRSF